MTTLLRAFAIVPVVAVAAAMIPTGSTMIKCGTLSPNGPLLGVDGVVTGPVSRDKPLGNLAKEDVYSIDIMCVDPVDSTFNRTHGWQLISLWTMQGPAPRLKEALNLIRDAQDAHYARHGRYITKLEEIPLPETMKPLRITLQADKKGWIARATVRQLLTTCSISDGVNIDPNYVRARQIECASDPR